MDLLAQVLLCLVFVLSIALYSRLGDRGQGQDGMHDNRIGQKGSSNSSKSKSKNKKTRKENKANTHDVSPTSQGNKEQTSSLNISSAYAAHEECIAKSKTESNFGRADEPDKHGSRAVVNSSSSSRKSLDDEAREQRRIATEHPASSERKGKTEEKSSDDAWQSVGKGAARAVRPPASAAATSYSSIASSNPFAVLPTSGTKTGQLTARSMSIPASATSASTRSKPSTSSQKGASAEEQTKRQRQNAARAAAVKQAKEEEERMRLARLEAYRREAQRERLKKEERQKFAKGVHSSGPNGSTISTGSPMAIRSNRGGLDSKASVNTMGQLVWD